MIKKTIEIPVYESKQLTRNTIMMVSHELRVAIGKHHINGGKGLPPGWDNEKLKRHCIIIK